MPGKATDEALTPTVDASDASRAPVSGEPRVPSPSGDGPGLFAADPSHYAIADEIARGGMGRILRARDLRLGRNVAIKELLAGHDDARFEREVRITARLEHPSIVSVHEAGRWPSGEPFFAMKLVAGTALDRHITAAPDLAGRLALVPNVIAVVDALAYAHSEHVIHRDLKPANVLCGKFGETVVIDWGLAKDLTAEEPDDVVVGPYRRVVREGETVAGAVLGTPAYMPPEQAAGERVDARADVYALGAMLYHVLAGTPPYTAQRTEEVLARVLEAAPPPLAEHVPEAPIELVAIVDKAMARDPADRFPTAREMADELKRFQTGQLVTSHRYTAGELARRWIRKNRGVVVVGAIATATLAIVGVASVRRIVTERHRADSEAQVVQARTDAATLDRARAALETDPSETLALLLRLGPGSPEWRSARTIAADALSRGVAFELHASGRPERLAFSLDGKRLIAVEAARLELWDLETGSVSHHSVRALPLAAGFAPDGQVLYVERERGDIHRWDPATNADVVVRAAELEYNSAAISPDGRRIALWSYEGSRLVEVGGADRPIGRYARGTWSADSKTLVGEVRGGIDRIDLATATATSVPWHGEATAVATDGPHVWVADPDGNVVDVTGLERPRDGGHGGATISDMIALADGAVVTASSTYNDRLPIEENEPVVGDFSVAVSRGGASQLVRLVGHRTEIAAIAATQDGTIASSDFDGNVRIWRRTPISVRPPDGRTTAFVFQVPDGRLAFVRRDPRIELRDLATGASTTLTVVEPPQPSYETQVTAEVGDWKIIEHTTGTGREVMELALAADPRRFVTIDSGGRVVRWDLARGGTVLGENGRHVATSSDGKRVLTGNTSTTGHDLWAEGVAVAHDPLPQTVQAVALSADGSQIARCTNLGAELVAHGRVDILLDDVVCHALAFTPDGRRLVIGDSIGKLHVFDIRTERDQALPAHAATITLLAFDPAGARVASAAVDGTVTVWTLDDLERGPIMLRGHTRPVTSIAFDGEYALTTSVDRTAHLWDLATGEGRALREHSDKVVFAMRTGGSIVTIDHDDRINTYPDDLPYDELGLRVRLAMATNHRVPH